MRKLLKILTFFVVLAPSVWADMDKYSIEFYERGSSVAKIVDLDIDMDRLVGEIESVDPEIISVTSIGLAADPWIVHDRGGWDYRFRIPLEVGFFSPISTTITWCAFCRWPPSGFFRDRWIEKNSHRTLLRSVPQGEEHVFYPLYQIQGVLLYRRADRGRGIRSWARGSYLRLGKAPSSCTDSAFVGAVSRTFLPKIASRRVPAMLFPGHGYLPWLPG